MAQKREKMPEHEYYFLLLYGLLLLRRDIGKKGQSGEEGKRPAMSYLHFNKKQFRALGAADYAQQ